jgi:Transcriptional regulators
MSINIVNEILDDLFVVLPTLNKKVFKSTEKILKERGMSLSHLRVMFILKKRGIITSTEIGKKLEVSKPNVTVLVDKLVEMNLIERSSGKDRRSISLSLTSEGVGFLQEYMDEVKTSFGDKLSNFSEEDFLMLRDAVINLKKIMDKIEEEK